MIDYFYTIIMVQVMSQKAQTLLHILKIQKVLESHFSSMN